MALEDLQNIRETIFINIEILWIQKLYLYKMASYFIDNVYVENIYGISGTLTINGNIVVTGDLTVNGSTVPINIGTTRRLINLGAGANSTQDQGTNYGMLFNTTTLLPTSGPTIGYVTTNDLTNGKWNGSSALTTTTNNRLDFNAPINPSTIGLFSLGINSSSNSLIITQDATSNGGHVGSRFSLESSMLASGIGYSVISRSGIDIDNYRPLIIVSNTGTARTLQVGDIIVGGTTTGFTPVTTGTYLNSIRLNITTSNRSMCHEILGTSWASVSIGLDYDVKINSTLYKVNISNSGLPDNNAIFRYKDEANNTIFTIKYKYPSTSILEAGFVTININTSTYVIASTLEWRIKILQANIPTSSTDPVYFYVFLYRNPMLSGEPYTEVARFIPKITYSNTFNHTISLICISDIDTIIGGESLVSLEGQIITLLLTSGYFVNYNGDKYKVSASAFLPITGTAKAIIPCKINNGKICQMQGITIY